MKNHRIMVNVTVSLLISLLYVTVTLPDKDYLILSNQTNTSQTDPDIQKSLCKKKNAVLNVLNALSEVQFYRKAEGGERYPIALTGVPLVSVLSPLVFLTAGGLCGLSTPNSCWLLAGGPHLTQWRQCNIQMHVHDGLRGHYNTEFHCIHMCIYEKLGPLL